MICKGSCQAQENEETALAQTCSSGVISIPCTGQRKNGENLKWNWSRNSVKFVYGEFINDPCMIRCKYCEE